MYVSFKARSGLRRREIVNDNVWNCEYDIKGSTETTSEGNPNRLERQW